MARSRICDFCLDEKGSFFRRLQSTPDGQLICSDCRRIIESYGLPVRFDLFQQLVVHDPEMRDMIMRSYLENHSVNDCIAKYYPHGKMMLHRGEELISSQPVTIRVDREKIPAGNAVTEITAVQKEDITNLPSSTAPDAVEVNGTLYETNAAVYFFSEHFLNVHRPTNLVVDSPDVNALHVIEKRSEFVYQTKNADLFLLRHKFYHILHMARKEKKNLIYLASENTMTLTPGTYAVPRNIKSGKYWISSVNDSGLSVTDAAGRVREYKDGQIELSDGSMLECTGEYQLRINQHEDQE